MLRAFLLSIGQLGDRPVLTVLAKSLALTLLLFVLLGVGLWFAAQGLVAWLGGAAAWQDLAGAAAVLLALGGAWLLFRAVAVAVVGIFADEVVVAVEAKHYPDALRSARDVSLARSVAMGLRSAVRAILVNVAMIPAYVLLLVTGIGTAIAFFLVNGWLLGRDLGEMVAARHMDREALRAWRAGTGIGRFLLGLAGTALFVIPVANILAPVLGAAMATHWFHGRQKP